MRDRPAVDPQRDGAFSAGAGLQVVHDQGRLWLPMDEEPRLFALNFDPYPGPLARFEVHVRLILAWRLLPEPEPGPIRMRDVLRGVIAAQLVVGTAIGGT